MFRKRSSRQFARRRAVTLMEMLLAAGVTGMTATAGATVMYAVSSASTHTRDFRVQRQSGHYALDRIGRVIRSSRAVCNVSSARVSLWLADGNENDTVDVQEIGRVTYDAAKHAIYFEYCDTGGNLPAANPVDKATMESDTGLDAALMAANPQLVYWADNIQSCVFSGHPDGVNTKMVMTEFEVGTKGETLVFHGSSALRAPGDYLFYNETRTEANAATPRVLKTKVAPWDGFKNLTEYVVKVLTK